VIEHGPMPFHVEIRRSVHLARAFNVDPEQLRQKVLDPWLRGKPIVLDERRWDPRESSLRIIEGPELAPTDLSMGRGWQRAERFGEDVTRSLLAAAAAPEPFPVAVLAETDATRRSMTGLLERLSVTVADWSAVRAGFVAAATVDAPHPSGGSDGVAALIAVERTDTSESWLFEAGLAVGALRGRAIVVQLSDQPLPPQLRELGAIRIDPDRPASLEALAERLRQAGSPATVPQA
jgi:hypothetical protein